MIQDTVTLEQGTVLFRIHDRSRDALRTDADTDPPSERRFSPLQLATDPSVLVGGVYLADSFEAAACETLLRYIAPEAERAPIIRSKLRRTVVSRLHLARDLTLVAVEDAILRNLQQCTPVVRGTSARMTTPPQDGHESPINATPGRYDYSQEAAHVMRAAFPDAHGLWWPSRHLSTRHCAVLWDDRITPSAVLARDPTGPHRLHKGSYYNQLADLIFRLNLELWL